LKRKVAPDPKSESKGTKSAKAGSILIQQALACFVSIATNLGSVVELTMPIYQNLPPDSKSGSNETKPAEAGSILKQQAFSLLRLRRHRPRVGG